METTAYGEKIRIGVIDTGFNTFERKYACEDGALDRDFTSTSLYDFDNHGRIVNELITQGLDNTKFCIINLKFIDKHLNTKDFSVDALNYLTTLKVKYVNISWSGQYTSRKEHKFLKQLLDDNVKVFVSAGNDNNILMSGMCSSYPACYIDLNLFVVGGLIRDKKLPTSNFGPVVRFWELGYYFTKTGVVYGTSFATPRALRRWIDEHEGK